MHDASFRNASSSVHEPMPQDFRRSPEPTITERSNGALARIDQAERSAALSLARTGRIFDLGLEINRRIPHTPDFARFSFAFTQTPEGTGAKSPFQFSAEVITGALHV